MTTTQRFDAIVIGAGSNGTVAAAALAKAGRRVLVLEQAESLGGQSRSIEFAPGFHAPLSTEADWLPPPIARGLGLTTVAVTQPQVSVALVTSQNECLELWCDPARSADAIRRHSPHDAARWESFARQLGKLAAFLEVLYQLPPPDIDSASIGDIGALIGVARKFRSLGRADMSELLRVLPMSVQDLLDDVFESELVKAAVGAGGVRDIRQGPRSGGTSFVLLHHLVGAPTGSVRARSWWREGPHVFVDAVQAVARHHKVEFRAGSAVLRILVRDDAVTGIALASGEEIAAPVVLSTADPARTLLGMIDPVWVDPEFLHALRNIKFRGCTAVVQYALDHLPPVPVLASAAQPLAGIVSLTPSLEALERAYDAAKYGGVSTEPHVEISVPTLRWPSLAPPGKHVLVARVQYAPYQLRDGTWDAARSCALGDATTRAITRVVPQFTDSVLYRAVLTPRDLEARFGLTEGAVTQGELMLDQILFMRPVAGWGRYSMPIDGLYLGGAGAHPGPGVLGGAGWLAAREVVRRAKRT